MLAGLFAIVGALCFLCVIGCHIWLILQITRNDALMGCLAVFVPFFALWYVSENWDIAKWPFLGQLFAIVGMLVAMVAIQAVEG